MPTLGRGVAVGEDLTARQGNPGSQAQLAEAGVILGWLAAEPWPCTIDLTASCDEENAMATLVSVNVGQPGDIVWNGRTVFTGAWKTPVAGPRMVRRLNIDGDGQGDLGGHGGENRAVLVYLESYRHWANEFNRDDLGPGLLGENLTVEGMPDDEVALATASKSGRPSSRSPSLGSPAIARACASANREWPRCWSAIGGPASTAG